ncbi:YncE family protein [Acidiphilium sp. PA]|uniref:YncE family protein n=1 Tax=Acidiphilium sp. PA TaxID=2871705 RepID=UPI0022443A07|nr:YncE family protein [Acidiphilium sp. PA]MCW8305647.1 YncE family protein [Acidiphilium sp. PA]
MTRFRLALALAASLLPAIAAAAPPHFAVTGSIPIAGPVKWDYLTTQPGTNCLFAAEGDRVVVVDTATRKPIATIAPIDGAHGIALAPRLNRGFATAGIAGTVTMFNLKTLKPIKTIDVAPGPDAIAYDPATERVFVPNEKTQALIAIDARTGKIIKRIPFHADPEFIVTDGRGTAYLNLNSADQIAVVNTRTLTIIRRIDVAPTCHGPTGLAIDRARERLFVSCRNHAVDVVAARSGRILATLPIPAFSDAMRFDPSRNLAFAPSIDGTLTVIGAAGKSGYKIVQTLKTAPTARTMAFDQATQTAYLSAATIVKTLPPAPGKTYGRPVFAPGSFRILIVRAEHH